jgi:hypothetical protein
MNACMLEVYMTMTGDHFFPKNQVPLTVTWMVYAEVVLGFKLIRRPFTITKCGCSSLVPVH